VEAEEALAAVRAFAADRPDFAAAWQKAVRDAADHATAQVTGALMGGRLTGTFGWEAAIPYPLTLTEEDTEEAYRHEVQAEVVRRINAMHDKPGGIGPAVAAEGDPE
jgi:hypothetical protein